MVSSFGAYSIIEPVHYKAHKAANVNKPFLVAWLVFILALVVGLFGLVVDKSIAKQAVYIKPLVSTHISYPLQSLAQTTPVHDYTIPLVANGAVPIIRRVPTSEKVAFLTIDDGIVTNPSDAQLMQAGNAKATFFLVYRFINTDYAFFNDLAARTGSDIENHTYDHYLLTNLTYDQQKADICKNADQFSAWFGKRPVLLRPSGGAYNDTTLHAAADCGMKALVLWDASINNGAIKYQNGAKMQPGDIVLMHFRATFQEDLAAFVRAANSAGLQPELLVDWL